MIAVFEHVGIKGAKDAARTLPRRIRVLRSLFGARVPIRPLGQPVSLRWPAGPPYHNARTSDSGKPPHLCIVREWRCLAPLAEGSGAQAIHVLEVTSFEAGIDTEQHGYQSSNFGNANRCCCKSQPQFRQRKSERGTVQCTLEVQANSRPACQTFRRHQKTKGWSR